MIELIMIRGPVFVLSCLAVFRSAAKVSGHPAFVKCASLMSVPELKKCRKYQTRSALMCSEIFELRIKLRNGE